MMTTTYELYTNENGTPKAVEGKAPAIIERVEALETSVESLEGTLDNGVVTSVNNQTGDVTVDVGVTSVNGNTGDITPEQTGCLPTGGGEMTGSIVIANNLDIKAQNDSGYVTYRGCTGWGKGSQITLYGKDHETNAGFTDIRVSDGTNTHSFILKPDGSATWDGKHLVRSVNGTNADASGNVTISVPTGTLSQKHSTSKTTVASNGSKTITISGLTAYKPVYFMAWQDPSTSTDYGQNLNVTIASGIVNITDGFTAGSQSNTGYYSFGAWNKSSKKGTLAIECIIPTGTSVAIKFSNDYSKKVTFSVKAWQ